MGKIRELLESRILYALIVKEILQIKKDKSILIIAFVLPLILIFITGYGLNMDIKHVEVGLYCAKQDKNCDKLYAQFYGSEYFYVSRYLTKEEAMRDFERDDLDAIMLLGKDFTVKMQTRGELDAMVYVNASSAQKGTIVQTYLQAAIASTFSTQAGLGAITATVKNRFNEENESSSSLVPGQLIGTVTLICAFMSSLIIAREYDRNTILFLKTAKLDALSVILAKLIPYYVISCMGTAICIGLSMIVFELPFRGSVPIFILTVMVYNLMANCIGLLISVIFKNQFLASEYAILFSMMPSLILSGAIFDLKAVARFIYYIAIMLPQTHAVQSFKICFLSGGQEGTLMTNIGILICFGTVFFIATVFVMQRDLR